MCSTSRPRCADWADRDLRRPRVDSPSPGPRARQRQSDPRDRRRAPSPTRSRGRSGDLPRILDREPETYPRAAAKWASRFAIERRLTLTDAQLALAALAALPTESARACAEALIELAARYRLQRIDELLTEWSERRGLGAETPN